jgi:CheY-like chemotaxis protein
MTGPEQSNVHSLRVLVADDNRDSAETLALLLEASGHRVTTVYDGQAAVQESALVRPDVMILDLGMPKLSGLDVCRSVRAMPRGSEVMIVALTGWGQAQDRDRTREAGFDVHLVKPVDHETLMRVIAQRGSVQD